MTADDFARLALSLPGAEEGTHFGARDFRVSGRIFATLAMVEQGYGNLMLTPELQQEFVRSRPDLFLAIPNGWGSRGATHIRLAPADETAMAEALRAAWQLRVQKNTPKKKAAKR